MMTRHDTRQALRFAPIPGRLPQNPLENNIIENGEAVHQNDPIRNAVAARAQLLQIQVDLQNLQRYCLCSPKKSKKKKKSYLIFLSPITDIHMLNWTELPSRQGAVR